MIDAELIDAIHEDLPLSQDVEWVDLSFLDAGLIAEKTKRKCADSGDGPDNRWHAVRLPDADCAAKVVELHNKWLDQKKEPS